MSNPSLRTRLDKTSTFEPADVTKNNLQMPTWLSKLRAETRATRKARDVLSDTGRRVGARPPIAMAVRCIEIAQSGLLAQPQSAQSLVKGFWSERLAGAEPRVARIMSMRARNVAGTCRCPG